MRIKTLTLLIFIYSCLLSNAQNDNKPFFANSIEEGMKDPENVKGIRLELLDSIPKEVIEFINMKTLILFECSIKYIPEELNVLDSINEIHLTSCSHFPKGLEVFKGLEAITLSGNTFQEMPVYAEKIKQLKTLVISDLYNKGVIPTGLGKFKSLEKITIGFVEDSKIMNQFVSLKYLKEIELLRTTVTCLEVKYWTTLTKIVLEGNKISEQCINDLTNSKIEVMIEQDGKSWNN